MWLQVPYLTVRGWGVIVITAALWFVFLQLGLVIAAQVALCLAIFFALTFLLCLTAWRPLELGRAVHVSTGTGAASGQISNHLTSGTPEILRGTPLATTLTPRLRATRWARLDIDTWASDGATANLSNTLGRHRFATPRCRITDPFGLWRQHATPQVTGITEVIVLPRTYELPLARRLAQHDAEAELSPIPREYVVGDEIRRVHWGASARRGKLMVRDVEPVQRLHASVVITPRLPEEAPHVTAIVETGLNIALNLAHHGFVVRILDGDDNPLAPALNATHTTPGRARLSEAAIHATQRRLALAQLSAPHSVRLHEVHDIADDPAHFSSPSIVFTVGAGEVSTRGGNPAHPHPINVVYDPEGPGTTAFSSTWNEVLHTL